MFTENCELGNSAMTSEFFWKAPISEMRNAVTTDNKFCYAVDRLWNVTKHIPSDQSLRINVEMEEHKVTEKHSDIILRSFKNDFNHQFKYESSLASVTTAETS